MGTSLVVCENNQQIEISIDDIRKYIASDLNEKEFWMFIQTAKTYGLNPLKREIYAVKYGNTFSVITGYHVYLQKVDDAEILEYWDCIVEKPEPKNLDTWIGVFTAKRKDWIKEFVWKVPMKEVNKKQALWNLQPEFQLRKVAISQGLRMLCPKVVGGMPYIADELGIEENHAERKSEIIEPPKPDPEAQRKMKIIEGVFKAIDANQTLKDLEAWVLKNVEKLSKSENKETYESHIKLREFLLTISLMAEKTGLENADVRFWYTELEHSNNKALDALLAGDDDAIPQIRAEIIDYLKSLTEIVDGAELEELGDGEKELNI